MVKHWLCNNGKQPWFNTGLQPWLFNQWLKTLAFDGLKKNHGCWTNNGYKQLIRFKHHGFKQQWLQNPSKPLVVGLGSAAVVTGRFPRQDLDQLKYDVGELKDLLGRWP